MFAIMKTGGKQYTVRQDDVITIERLDGESGDKIVVEDVLMLGDGDNVTVGNPYVDGASVSCEIVEQGRGEKIIVFKKRRRQKSERTKGHRQNLSTIKVLEILTGGKKASAAPKVKAKDAPAKKEEAEIKPIFTAPEGEKDDLKKISGVGPVFEKNLNALGITTYEQVANFSPADIEKLEDAIGAHGRVEREEWLKQAAELAKSS